MYLNYNSSCNQNVLQRHLEGKVYNGRTTGESDNTSTCLAAADELQQLLQSEHLTEALGRNGVQWQVISKHAPWYGGW